MLYPLKYGAPSERQWLRETMNRDVESVLNALDPASLDAVEISGALREGAGWRTYRRLSYPEFDVCGEPAFHEAFDIAICEQILEHVEQPLKALENLRAMVRAGGYVLVSTPFLVKIHGDPGDFWRFTPAGLERLLRCAGLRPEFVRS